VTGGAALVDLRLTLAECGEASPSGFVGVVGVVPGGLCARP
jgi:hypothetical protein